MKTFTLITTILALGYANAAEKWIQGESLLKKLNIRGSVASVENSKIHSAWPGVELTTQFTGSKIEISFSGVVGFWAVNIDGKWYDPWKNTYEGNVFKVEDLSSKNHSLKIVRRSENWVPTYVDGIRLESPKDSLIKPKVVKRPQVVFLGDSHVVAYGNESPGSKEGLQDVSGRECNDDEIIKYTNTYNGFAWLSARALNYDPFLFVRSGLGIVRNWGGSTRDPYLPEIFPREAPTKESAITKMNLNPELVVLEPGSNDFSTPLKEGEKWSERSALQADFKTAYLQVIKDVRKRWPNVKILIMTSPIPEVGQMVKEILEAHGKDDLIKTVSFQLKGYGCQWHPDMGDHKDIAEKISGVMEDWMDWEFEGEIEPIPWY